MLFDQLNVKIDENECVRTNNIVNGYFYILYYNALNERSIKDGFDRMPVIYSFAPDMTNINCFWGINFHYFSKSVQGLILRGMSEIYDITNGDDKRIIIDPDGLNFIYSNIKQGARCYNRKGVIDAYRIKNRFIPKYLEVDGVFAMTTQENNDIEFALADGNKGF